MKGAQLPKLADRTIFEKTLFGFRIILSISVIVTAALELINVVDLKSDVSQLLLGGMFFIIFLEYRKYNILQAVLSLAVSIFIISIFILESSMINM